MPAPTQAGTLTKFSIGNNATTNRTITGVAAGAALVLWIAPERFAAGYTGEVLTVSCPSATFVRIGHQASFSNNAGGQIRQEASIYLATNVSSGSHTVTIQAANIGGNANATEGSWVLSEFPGVVAVAPGSATAAPAVSGRIANNVATISVGPTDALSQAQSMVLALFVGRFNYLWNGADPGVPPSGHTLVAQDTENTTAAPMIASWQDVNSTAPITVGMGVVAAPGNGDGTRGVVVAVLLASGSNYVEILVQPDTEDGVSVNGTTGWTVHVAAGDPKDGFVVYSGIAARSTGNEIRVAGAGGAVGVGGTVNVQVVNAGLGYTSGWGVGTVRASA